VSLAAALLAAQPPRPTQQQGRSTRSAPVSAPDGTTVTAPRIEDTPYADSLYALAGRPAQVGTIADPRGESPIAGGRLVGQYRATGDVLRLARTESPASQQQTLAHELAHRLVSDHSPDWSYLQAFHAKRQQPGRPAPTGYAATDAGEHFAEAFAAAVGALRGARAHPESLSVWRQAAERAVPGADTLVTTLLQKPLYRGAR
jgi:hypothetical protein